ncbi:hypothetical protein ROD_40901 [Citrobacter rodentium ICC168]|uniref:Uncharacterized protein n=1 Tax=Citrobacter rodentium (strain ICC168) TaxID=637910 RepID=D2TI14_CITRI|nr:hypothetical protein ROD_40901 [Citrobacter rodentium ICC168]
MIYTQPAIEYPDGQSAPGRSGYNNFHWATIKACYQFLISLHCM